MPYNMPEPYKYMKGCTTQLKVITTGQSIDHLVWMSLHGPESIQF